jgi:DNA topoisomerase-1
VAIQSAMSAHPAAMTAEDEARDEATEAHLRYTPDDRPGITRRRAGRGFSYRTPDGTRITDAATLARIRALAVPPAWTDVWICTDPRGHLQATGRDARGRKQYRYHARWQRRRGESKFERMLVFASVLPHIREHVDADLGRRGLPREKVLAAVVRLLELTHIRVGSDEYVKLNRSFGLTTLRNRHAKVDGTSVRFRFKGKSGREHEVDLRDRRLASIVRRCQELPGQELFEYLDADGAVRDVSSTDVNAYLREVAGKDITAKDFRTWAGTVLAYRALRAQHGTDDPNQARRDVVSAVKTTAERLGNTPAVARGSYIHPAVVEAYLEGSLVQHRKVTAAIDRAEAALPDPVLEPPEPEDEAEVIDLLKRRLDDDAARSTGRPAHSTRSRAHQRRRPG